MIDRGELRLPEMQLCTDKFTPGIAHAPRMVTL
jgi:hypothetical protein